MANMNKTFKEDMREFNVANPGTTKLIQELVGLCVEKSKDSGLFITVSQGLQDGKIYNVAVEVYRGRNFVVSLSFENTPKQIKAAIDKVKELS